MISLADPRVIACGAAMVVALLLDLFVLKRFVFRWLIWSAVCVLGAFCLAPIDPQYDRLDQIAGRIAFGAAASLIFCLRAVVSEALSRRIKP